MKGSKRHHRNKSPKVINKGLDYELLAKNVFLLMAKKDVILANENMRNCVLNINNHTYLLGGDLSYMPLSGYFEWWDKALDVMRVNDDGMRGIVIQWACSQLTGVNTCSMVFENGQIEDVSIREFKSNVHLWLNIRKQFDKELEYPSKLTLQDVIDKLLE